MAGDLKPGYIYFIEKEAAQQNWAHEPDDIVIGNFTEGTHYCKFKWPKGWRVMGKTGTVVTTLGGSIQYSLRSAKRYYIGGCNGIVTTIANANLMDSFIMSDRHTSGASATFKPYYLICYHGLNSSNLVPKFTDHNSTQRAYCRCEIIDWQRVWADVEHNWEKVNIKFVSVWQ